MRLFLIVIAFAAGSVIAAPTHAQPDTKPAVQQPVSKVERERKEAEERRFRREQRMSRIKQVELIWPNLK